jgi:hypothetical protein
MRVRTPSRKLLLLGHVRADPTRVEVWEYCSVKTAVCDPDAFYPVRKLVSGRFNNEQDLQHFEPFFRTVELHDEIVMELDPFPFDEGAARPTPPASFIALYPATLPTVHLLLE